MTDQEREDLIDYYVHTLRGDRSFIESMDDADLRVAVLIREAEVQEALESNEGGGRTSANDSHFFRSNFGIQREFQEGKGFDSLHDFMIAGSAISYGVTYVSIILFLAVAAMISVTALFLASKGHQRDLAKEKVKTVALVAFLVSIVPALILILVKVFSK